MNKTKIAIISKNTLKISNKLSLNIELMVNPTIIPNTVIISATLDKRGYPRVSGSIPLLKMLKDTNNVIGIVRVNENILAINAIIRKLPNGVSVSDVKLLKNHITKDTHIGVIIDAIILLIIVLFKSLVRSENFGFINPKFNPVPNRDENIPDKLPLMFATTGSRAKIPAIPAKVGDKNAHKDPVNKLPSNTMPKASEPSFNNFISGL